MGVYLRRMERIVVEMDRREYSGMCVKKIASALIMMGLTAVPAFEAAAESFVGRSIGVNFESSATNTIPPEAYTGYPDVAQANWNSCFPDYVDQYNGIGTRASWTNFMDSTGEPVKGLQIKLSGSSENKAFPMKFASWGWDNSDGRYLQWGGIYPAPRFEITGIPYDRYDIYVYWNAGVSSGSGSMSITDLEGSSIPRVDPAGEYFLKGPPWGASFVRTTYTSREEIDASGSKSANFMIFENNSTKSLALQAYVQGTWIGVTGLQIVEKPPLGTTFTFR